MSQKHSVPQNQRNRRIAAASALLIAAAGVIHLQTRSGSDVSQELLSEKTSARTHRGTSDADRLAKLEKLGAEATPIQPTDPSGPPVPALVSESEVMASGWKRDPSPTMVEFSDWAERYVAADEASRATLLDEGILAAQARRAELATLIEKDPRRALTNTLPLMVRDEMPEPIQELLETRIHGFGDLGIEHSLPLPGHPDIPDKGFAQIDDQKYEAFSYGRRKLMHFIQDASIHGIEIDGRLAVLDSPMKKMEAGEAPRAEVIDACRVDEIPGAVAVQDDAPPAVYQLGDTASISACCSSHIQITEANILQAENDRKLTGGEIASNSTWLPSPHAQYMSDSGVSGLTGTLGRPPTSHTHGTKRVLVMRATSSQRPLQSGLTTAHVTSQAANFHSRFEQISYGKMGLQCDVTPIYTMPAHLDKPFNDPTFNRDAWHNECKAQAAAAGYNLANYHNFTTILNDTGAGYAGVAAGNLIIQNGNFDAWVYMHEFGHFLSLPHAESWQSSDGNPMSPSRWAVGYGDWGCYMGNNGSNHFSRTFSPTYLNKLGWLTDSNIQTVTRSGVYTVYQHDGVINLSDGRARGLKLPRDNQYNYWLSIAANTDPGQSGHNNGVAIRASIGWSGSQTWLLDMNNPSGGSHDAPLALNQTWYDSAADLTLKTIEVGGTNPNRYARVEVTIGPRHNSAYRPLVSGGVYRFKSRYNGKFLEIAGNSSANAVPVTVGNASGTASQNWVVWRQSDGSYSLNHQGTDKWIDVDNNSSANGAEIWQYTGNSSDAQKWWMRQNPDGFLYIMHKGTEGVIDMDPSGVNDVKQHQNFGATWQQWEPELVGISDGTYRVLPRHAQGQGLDIAGGSTSNGALAQLYTWGDYGSQRFIVTGQTSGRLRFSQSNAPGKALDVDASGSANGTKVHQWDWFNNSAQRWSYSRTDTNWLRLTPDCAPGSCLEISGNDTAVGNGSRVQIWQWLGAQDQQWRFADAH